MRKEKVSHIIMQGNERKRTKGKEQATKGWIGAWPQSDRRTKRGGRGINFFLTPLWAMESSPDVRA